jgi:S-adenosylmethionine hydrolase
MATITLLTDFGTNDEFVGVMKGAILSVNPSATIIDITHQVDPQDIVQAAYLVPSYYKYFPKGTVHIIVVDPGVGSDRCIIALEITDHLFLAPDNGVLSLLLDSGDIDSAVSVHNSSYFLTPVSQTFHGRDIFAPVGAHLSLGVEISKMGTPIDQGQLLRLRIPKPYLTDAGELMGAIISSDRFGNLVTNIKLDDINALCGPHPGAKPIFEIGESRIEGLSKSYPSAGLETPLALIGSRGYLEIAVNRSNAQQRFRVEKMDPIRVILAKRRQVAEANKID